MAVSVGARRAGRQPRRSTLLAPSAGMANVTGPKGNGTTDAKQTTSMTRLVHDDIEQTLGSRTAHGGVAARIEGAVKGRGQAAWRAMKRHPFVTIAAVAVGGVAAAASVGVAELAFGGALAFAAYKVLREGEPPMEAIEQVERDVGG